MKKKFALFLLAGAMALTSCSVGGKSDEALADFSCVTPIYSLDGDKLFEITHSGNMSLCNDMIVYFKAEKVSEDTIETMGFYIYDILEKTSYKVGGVDNWEYCSYFNSAVDNGHFYTLVASWKDAKREDMDIKLLDIDLSKKTLSEAAVIEDGFIYDTMTVQNGSVYIAEQMDSDSSKIIEYNSADRSVTEHIPSLYKKGNDNFINQITSDGTNLYCLRVQYGADETEVFVDKLDDSFNVASSRDITSLFDDIEDKDIIEDAKEQLVSTFYVKENTMFYGDQVEMQKLLHIEGDKFVSLIDKKDNFMLSCAYNTKVADDDIVLINELKSCAPDTKNYIYHYDGETLERAEFNHPNDSYELMYGCINEKGDMLLSASTEDNKDQKLYYFNIDDLDFEKL